MSKPLNSNNLFIKWFDMTQPDSTHLIDNLRKLKWIVSFYSLFWVKELGILEF